MIHQMEVQTAQMILPQEAREVQGALAVQEVLGVQEVPGVQDAHTIQMEESRLV